MEAEFDTVAGWTAGGGPRARARSTPIPAGCRGSGSEGALRWLADRLDLRSGHAAARRRARASAGPRAGWRPSGAVRPVCAEPMAAAVPARAAGCSGCPRWSRSAQELPFADGVVRRGLVPRRPVHDTPTRRGALTELRRVLADGGRLGLLVFVADGPLPPPLPEGNDVPLRGRAARPARRRRVHGSQATTDADLADSPPEWTSGPTPSRPRSPVGTATTPRSGRRRSSPAGSAGCSRPASSGPGSALR